MEFEFSGAVWFWKGPSPYHFVSVPDEESAVIEDTALAVTYGWGMIPVSANVGETGWTTSLWPKEGRYILPLKDAVRRAEDIELEDVVSVRLRIDV